MAPMHARWPSSTEVKRLAQAVRDDAIAREELPAAPSR
jgi:hypothetical protein